MWPTIGPEFSTLTGRNSNSDSLSVSSASSNVYCTDARFRFGYRGLAGSENEGDALLSGRVAGTGTTRFENRFPSIVEDIMFTEIMRNASLTRHHVHFIDYSSCGAALGKGLLPETPTLAQAAEPRHSAIRLA